MEISKEEYKILKALKKLDPSMNGISFIEFMEKENIKHDMDVYLPVLENKKLIKIETLFTEQGVYNGVEINIFPESVATMNEYLAKRKWKRIERGSWIATIIALALSILGWKELFQAMKWLMYEIHKIL